MTHCQWCGQPAVECIEIEPAQHRMVTKRSPITGEAVTAPETVRFAIHADVCERHGGVRDREGGTPLRDPRRTKAVGTVQLNIFGGESAPTAPRKPTSAIGGLP